MIYNKNIILEVLNIPTCKSSPEERTAEKEDSRNIMNWLYAKSIDDIKDAFKFMVGEMLQSFD